MADPAPPVRGAPAGVSGGGSGARRHRRRTGRARHRRARRVQPFLDAGRPGGRARHAGPRSGRRPPHRRDRPFRIVESRVAAWYVGCSGPPTGTAADGAGHRHRKAPRPPEHTLRGEHAAGPGEQRRTATGAGGGRRRAGRVQHGRPGAPRVRHRRLPGRGVAAHRGAGHPGCGLVRDTACANRCRPARGAVRHVRHAAGTHGARRRARSGDRRDRAADHRGAWPVGRGQVEARRGGAAHPPRARRPRRAAAEAVAVDPGPAGAAATCRTTRRTRSATRGSG